VWPGPQLTFAGARGGRARRRGVDHDRPDSASCRARERPTTGLTAAGEVRAQRRHWPHYGPARSAASALSPTWHSRPDGRSGPRPEVWPGPIPPFARAEQGREPKGLSAMLVANLETATATRAHAIARFCAVASVLHSASSRQAEAGSAGPLGRGRGRVPVARSPRGGGTSAVASKSTSGVIDGSATLRRAETCPSATGHEASVARKAHQLAACVSRACLSVSAGSARQTADDKDRRVVRC